MKTLTMKEICGRTFLINHSKILEQGTRFIVLTHDKWNAEAQELCNAIGGRLKVRNTQTTDNDPLINLTNTLTDEDLNWAHGVIYWFDCTNLDVMNITMRCGSFGVNAYCMTAPDYTWAEENHIPKNHEDVFQWNSPIMIYNDGDWQLDRYSSTTIDQYIINQADVIEHQDPVNRLQHIFADEDITFDRTLWLMASPIMTSAITTILPEVKVNYIKSQLDTGNYDSVAFLNLDEALIPASFKEVQKVCDILHRDGVIKPDQMHYFTADERVEELYSIYGPMIGAEYNIQVWGCRTFELNTFSYCHHLDHLGAGFKDDYADQLDSIKSKLKRPVVPRAKRFLSFNRVPKGNRIQMAAFMLRNPKIKAQTLMSLGFIPEQEIEQMKQHLLKPLNEHLKFVEESRFFDPKDPRRSNFSKIGEAYSINCYADYRGAKRIVQDMETIIENAHSFPWSVDIPAERVLAENPAEVITEGGHAQLHDDTVLQLVHETLFNEMALNITYDREEWDDDYRVSSFHDPLVYALPIHMLSHLGSIFFSEKTFKPIIWKQPFIVYATAGHLAALRETGYRTFHPIIDETYDTVESDLQRMELIEAEITRISEMSDTEILEFEQQCREIVEHNYNWFFTPYRRLAVGDKKLHKYIA